MHVVVVKCQTPAVPLYLNLIANELCCWECHRCKGEIAFVIANCVPSKCLNQRKIELDSEQRDYRENGWKEATEFWRYENEYLCIELCAVRRCQWMHSILREIDFICLCLFQFTERVACPSTLVEHPRCAIRRRPRDRPPNVLAAVKRAATVRG